MSNWYVSSVAYAAVAQWAASTAYSVGQIVRQLGTPTVGNERCFRCTTAGTSGASAPTWVLTKGSTTADNTVVWTEITGQEAYQSPGNWTAPCARIQHPTSVTGWWAAGDTVYVAADHNESSASGTIGTLGSPTTATGIIPIICVDSSASSSIPPASGDYRTTARYAQTGGSTLQNCHVYGITFSSGGSQTITNISADSCAISSGGITANGRCDLFNTSVSTPSINFNANGLITIRSSSGTVFSVVALQTNTVGTSGHVILEGLDASNVSAFVSSGSQSLNIVILNCRVKSNANFNVASTRGTHVDVINCDSGTAVYRHERWWFEGHHTVSAAVTKTSGGATDGTTPISWNIVTSATSNSIHMPFETMPIATWNGTIGSPVTVAIEGIYNGATLPTNMQISMLTSYFSNSLYPLGNVDNNNVLASNPLITSGTSWPATTTSWSGTDRSNSTAYTLGTPIAVSSAPGQIFFCTTAGTSASSLPAGYASCADGATVTDGTAVFRAGVRFKMSTSVTPQMVGFIRAALRVIGSSLAFYIDPMITLS